MCTRVHVDLYRRMRYSRAVSMAVQQTDNQANKPPTSFRLTEAAREQIAALSAHLGVSQTAVVELAMRELSRKQQQQQRSRQTWDKS